MPGNYVVMYILGGVGRERGCDFIILERMLMESMTFTITDTVKFTLTKSFILQNFFASLKSLLK